MFYNDAVTAGYALPSVVLTGAATPPTRVKQH